MISKTFLSFLFVLFTIFVSLGQTIPTPKEHFGFNIGDDYKLANYTQSEAYFLKLAAISNRVKVVDIGLTEEGRHQYMLIVSSPENLKKLDRYKAISQRLTHASDLTPEAAKALSQEGKPVVWIDGGLHATETVGAHQLIETYYQLVSRTDKETMQILDNVIILLSQVNPDGQELVSNWYMQGTDDKKRNMKIPRLYQKYVGHDNNRDFYMNNMAESINISRQQYIEWMPQIIYNHHQSGPAGSVVAGPPYRDPFNHTFDPMVITGLDAVAAAMINRLNVEDKPGYTRLAGSVYSTWWNGGLRTTPYFHNMIGILTEIIGSPTPASVPLVPARLVPNNATPNPVTPQSWSFRQSIDYSVSLNYAVLDYARRSGDELLFNIYKMGSNAIERGSRDNWTLLPKYSAAVATAMDADKKKPKKDTATIKIDSLNTETDSGKTELARALKIYDSVYKDPALRDARGYVISQNQPDFPTAVKFVNTLIKSGIQVHKATAAFTLEGKAYPEGSYVIKTNQAFRPHLLDMFEPQDHPNDFQYPGGPPLKPYDVAGWTLAYQMGIKFDRILNAFDGPFVAVPYGEMQKAHPHALLASKKGYVLNSQTNDAYMVVNNLLNAGIPVSRIPVKSGDNASGSFYVSEKGKTILEKAVTDYGIQITSVSTKPANTIPISKSRIALFDQYGGSMPSGWVRWLLEQNNFAFTVIYPNDIDSTDLRSKYDVILFMGGGMPPLNTKASELTRKSRDPLPSEIPEEYRPWLGNITAEKSIPALKTFMENGGTIFTVGSSTLLAYHLELPVRNALMEMSNSGTEHTLAADKYYIPGSVLQVVIDTTHRANWGMEPLADVVFSNSPVFRLNPDAALKGVKSLAWFGDSKTLRSGWAWGISYLQGGVVSFEAQIGKGKFYAFGPEIIFRAQSHSTFKLLFNELYQ